MSKLARGMMLGIMVMMLSGCGRPPTAPEGSGKQTPSPVHTRTASVPGVR